MTAIDDEREALIARFDMLRNSGVCSPTTRGLLDDAEALLRRQGPITDEWEYGQSEVLEDGTTAFGKPVATLAEAIRGRDIDRLNYPWPEELGVGRRRKAGPWEPVEAARDAS